MCGILAGNGRISGGKYKGIAPECNIICGKVLDKKGAGSLRNLNKGLIWIIRLTEKYPVRIVNISIEIDMVNDINKEEIELLKSCMDILWEKDILVVVAAGNGGPKPMSISMIGDQGKCICVGCHDDGYVGNDGRCCLDYSGRGPGKLIENYGNGANPLKKPDIVAPGTDIISCNSNIMRRGQRYINAYISKSGTSMSTPVVSGVCALALQKYPYLTNKDILHLLQKTARDLGEKWSIQGAGMIKADIFLKNIIK